MIRPNQEIRPTPLPVEPMATMAERFLHPSGQSLFWSHMKSVGTVDNHRITSSSIEASPASCVSRSSAWAAAKSSLHGPP